MSVRGANLLSFAQLTIGIGELFPRGESKAPGSVRRGLAAGLLAALSTTGPACCTAINRRFGGGRKANGPSAKSCGLRPSRAASFAGLPAALPAPPPAPSVARMRESRRAVPPAAGAGGSRSVCLAGDAPAAAAAAAAAPLMAASWLDEAPSSQSRAAGGFAAPRLAGDAAGLPPKKDMMLGWLRSSGLPCFPCCFPPPPFLPPAVALPRLLAPLPPPGMADALRLPLDAGAVDVLLAREAVPAGEAGGC